jgi:PKD repeat protein
MFRAAACPRRAIAALGLALALGLAVVAVPAHADFPVTSTPELRLNHTLRTSPFAGSSVSIKDSEGSAYVPRDGSLWIVDDDGKKIYEVDPTTGALKRIIDSAAFAATPRLGGSTLAGSNRNLDLESMAYDETNDALYLFSGSCCSSSVLPTAFRLTRQSGSLKLESWQPLPSGSDFTGAAWNPGDGKVYVGLSKNLRTYDYATSAVGPTFQIPNLSGILGMSFSSDGKDLYVARSSTLLSRVDWASKQLVTGWTFNLGPFGMKDTRAVERIGDQFWVADGYDSRSSGDPLRHATFVFDVVGSTGEPPPPPGPTAPKASFTASPSSGTAPLTVSFTDTSTGTPTSWSWNFGDGQSSSSQNPSHLYPNPGSYNVTLTATNTVGSSTARNVVTVGTAPVPGENLIGNPGFETGTDGWNTSGYAAVVLARVSGGHSGSSSAKLTNTGTTSVTMALNDNPNWVATSQAGSYTGSVWVRADSPGAKVYLRIREFQGTTKVRETLVGVTLSTSWQQVTGSLVPTAPGSSSIDFSVAVYSAAAGSVFYADDAALTH